MSNKEGVVKIIMGTRLVGHTRDIQELNTSLQFTQKEVDEVISEQFKDSECSNSLQSDIFKVCEVFKVLKNLFTRD